MIVRSSLIIFLLFCSFDLVAQTSLRWIDLDWADIAQAQSYELEIYQDKDGPQERLMFQENVKESKWSRQVAPGQYQFRLRALDRRSVPGPWSDFSLIDVRYPRPIYVYPLPNDQLKGVEVEQERIRFEWRPISGAQVYYFEIWSQDGFEESKFVRSFETTIWLPVAKKYWWRVVALDSEEDGISDREGEGISFFLNGGGLAPPNLSSRRKPNASLYWDEVKLADHYEILIYQKGLNQRWTLIERRPEIEKTTLDLTNFEEGLYRVAVKSTARGRTDSAQSYVELSIDEKKKIDIGSSRVQTGSELKDETPFFYGYGVEFMQVDYQGLTFERDTELNTTLSGTRFFLETSYQDFFSRWKHRLSFYYQQLKNLDNSVGLLEANYLIGQYYGKGRVPVEVSYGVFYKDDLFIEADVFLDKLSFQKVSNLGPFIRINPTYTFNRFIDLSLELKLYFHALAVSTPNDEDLAMTMTGSTQMAATYKRDELRSYTIFAGLYKSGIKYNSTVGDPSSSSSTSIAPSGSQNEANSTGMSVGIRINSYF